MRAPCLKSLHCSFSQTKIISPLLIFGHFLSRYLFDSRFVEKSRSFARASRSESDSISPTPHLTHQQLTDLLALFPNRRLSRHAHSLCTQLERVYDQQMSALKSSEPPIKRLRRAEEKTEGDLDRSFDRDYSVPELFSEDFFSLLDREDGSIADDEECDPLALQRQNQQQHKSLRPSFRWQLCGPQRSGSSFHKDPNHTSAWNGTVCGAKLWLFWPPATPPPGVFASQDQMQVTTPISVSDWFSQYFEAAAVQLESAHLHRPKLQSLIDHCLAHPDDSTSELRLSELLQLHRPLQVIQYPGDIIFVPNGWWHTAYNCTWSWAFTQNFVPKRNIGNVRTHLQMEGAIDDHKQQLSVAFDDALRGRGDSFWQEVESMVPLDVVSMQQKKKEKRRGQNSIWSQLCSPPTTEESRPKFSFRIQDPDS